MIGTIERAMFEAPWWAVLINPHFLSRRALWGAMRDASSFVKGRVLDVGCGVQPYRSLLTSADRITGLEIDTPSNRVRKNADVYYDGTAFPFTDTSFDTVLCNQVLEHVFAPEGFVAELARVLTPRGILLLSVPFMWPEHEQPWDAQRYSSYGLGSCLERAGFEIVEQRKLVPGMAALIAIAIDRVNENTRVLAWPFKLIVRVLVICPLSLFGLLAAAASSPKSALYLDNFVVARKRPDVGIAR